MHDDRRLARRLRTRLRSARLYTLHGTYITDCQLIERSVLGARVRLDAARVLPARLYFYDDEQRLLTPVAIRWRNGQFCGLSFTGRPERSDIINPTQDDVILAPQSQLDLARAPDLELTPTKSTIL